MDYLWTQALALVGLSGLFVAGPSWPVVEWRHRYGIDGQLQEVGKGRLVVANGAIIQSG